VLLTVGQLQASTIKGGSEVTISEPVAGNLYAGGGKVYINAPIEGDLICAGGEVSVLAPVAADILLAGGEVRISSAVGGDLRMGGGKVRLEANVAGDLIITGGELYVKEGVMIGGDVMIAGGKVIFEGIVQGDVMIAGGEATFNGKTAGKMDMKGGKIYLNGEVKGLATLAAQELNIGSDAAFYSNVQYWNEKGDANFEGHLYDGATAKYNEDLKFKTSVDREIVKKGFMAFAAFRFVSAALLMTLLVALFGRFFEKNTRIVRENIGNYVGTGMLFLFGVPVVAFLAFATIVGIPIGFIMLSGYGIALMLANSLTAVVGAYELKKYLHRDWNKGILILVSVAGFVALRMVGMLAIPGKFIVFAATAIAIGAVIQWMRKGWQKADDTPDSSASGSSEGPSDTV
jgi:cytoskeletal protein CcmA (bactofilin family)